MKTFRLLILTLLLVTSPAFADKADALLERYIEASGGKDKIARIQDLVMRGEVRMPQMNMRGDLTMATKNPDKVMMDMTLPGLGKIITAYDGKKGWAHDPIQGYREISEAETRQMRDFSSLQKLLDFRQTYPVRRSLGEKTFNGETFDSVHLETAEGDEMIMHFRQSDGLATRLETKADMGPGGTIRMTAISRDFRPIDGVLFPHQIEVRHPVMGMTLTFSEIRTNVGVRDETFQYNP